MNLPSSRVEPCFSVSPWIGIGKVRFSEADVYSPGRFQKQPCPHRRGEELHATFSLCFWLRITTSTLKLTIHMHAWYHPLGTVHFCKTLCSVHPFLFFLCRMAAWCGQDSYCRGPRAEDRRGGRAYCEFCHIRTCMSLMILFASDSSTPLTRMMMSISSRHCSAPCPCFS
jgi:hypothetical protein